VNKFTYTSKQQSVYLPDYQLKAQLMGTCIKDKKSFYEIYLDQRIRLFIDPSRTPILFQEQSD